MSAAVARMQRAVEAALGQLEAEFKPGVKLTFIARHPGYDERDVLITSDAVPDVLKLVQRRLAAEAPPADPPAPTAEDHAAGLVLLAALSGTVEQPGPHLRTILAELRGDAAASEVAARDTEDALARWVASLRAAARRQGAEGLRTRAAEAVAQAESSFYATADPWPYDGYTPEDAASEAAESVRADAARRIRALPVED